MSAQTMEFDGATYEPVLDKERLSRQLQAVKSLMEDGKERTLGEIAQRVGGSEAGVSARLRDLRKKRYGGRVVLRARIRQGANGRSGLWVYRLVPLS